MSWNPFKWIGEKFGGATRLKDEIRRKISEAHLQIRTGECTEDQLNQATETLKSIKDLASRVKIL